MERGGEREHLAPFCYGWMNDGMEVYSCGLDREVVGVGVGWGFTSITLLASLHSPLLG